MKRWNDLDEETQAVAFHEAAHGVVAEMLGWKVKSLELFDGGGGEVLFFNTAPSPAIDLVVSVVGVVAECLHCGYDGGGSCDDRLEACHSLEMCGVDEDYSLFAVSELEDWVWPILTDEAVAEAIERLAFALGKSEFVTRSEFLRLARSALNPLTRRRIRRFAERIASDVLAKAMT